MINTEGLDQRDVLCALFNASRPQGMGFLHYTNEQMTREDAEQLLKQCKYFDYLRGRVMKVRLDNPNGFEEFGYDRDNGKGASQRIIDALRANNADVIAKQHKEGVLEAAALANNRLNEETRNKLNPDGSLTVTLGLADVKDKLQPAIQAAKDSVRK